MNPHQARALRVETHGLRLATFKLVRSTTPVIGRTIELPRINGGPARGNLIAMDHALEQTLGALASAHHKLAAHGIGLARVEPLRTRLVGELAGVEIPSGRAWLELETRGTR